MSRLLIASEDEHVFLTAGVLPVVDSAAELAIVFRYATGQELQEVVEPDGSLIVLAPSARTEMDETIDASWVPVSDILAAFGRGEFDDETGTAVTLYAARAAGLGEQAQ